MGISLAGSRANGAVKICEVDTNFLLTPDRITNDRVPWPPVDIFKKQFLHCYFLFQVSSYILFYCSLLGALFY